MITAVTAAGVIGLLAACGSSTSKASSPPSTAGAAASNQSSSTSQTGTASAAMIHISNFKYMSPTSVSPGATVSVMNMDGENHTVTADSGNAFDDKATAGASTTFTAPIKPGSYPFHCNYHSNMHGVLIVK